MSDDVLIDRHDGVMTVRMNRPARKNALTVAMYDAMTDALEAGAADRDVRVAVFLGSEGTFTAGNDLNDFLNNPARGGEPRGAQRFIRFLATTDLPLVAAVDGAAVGIGTTMLFHCDYVCVTERAHLQMPFVDLALVPEAGSSFLAPRLLGHAKASELLMFGRPFNGAEAVELDIANAVCPPDELEASAMEAARTLAAKPPAALRATKALLRHSEGHLGNAMEREIEAFASRLQSAEAKEAFSAFLEKRKPDFSNCG